jgi:hypothetical protein
VAVVVVAVVLLSALLALGVFAPPHPSGDFTYRTASSVVASYLSSFKGGGWTILSADGIASHVSITSPPFNGSIFSGVAGCTFASFVANGTVLTLPAFDGSLSSGESNAWAFSAHNQTSLLELVLLNGTVTPLFGMSCPGFGLYSSFLGSLGGVIDSNQAISAAFSAGGAQFVALHPDATEVMALSPHVTLVQNQPAEWNIVLQACDTTAPGPIAPTFNVTVNALNGTVTAQGDVARPCGSVGVIPGLPGGGSSSGTGGGTTLPSSLSIASSGASQAGPNYYENFTLGAASNGVSWDDLQLEVLGPNGALEPSVVAFQVFSPGAIVPELSSGGPVESYAWQGTGNGAAPIQPLSTLEVVSTSSLAGHGASLQVVGDSSYSGQLSAAIP